MLKTILFFSIFTSFSESAPACNGPAIRQYHSECVGTLLGSLFEQISLAMILSRNTVTKEDVEEAKQSCEEAKLNCVKNMKKCKHDEADDKIEKMKANCDKIVAILEKIEGKQ
ncbi:unnamed protein product [Caenorhabditis angaria]|uniref:DUF19 domain-containing protein n=1 Tax=Caenorhabditis angaria TaxID=860376 RepID=A0A9P1N3F8_9PELO|nr:unnamed protein product [Caenorhabditis angaria]